MKSFIVVMKCRTQVHQKRHDEGEGPQPAVLWVDIRGDVCKNIYSLETLLHNNFAFGLLPCHHQPIAAVVLRLLLLTVPRRLLYVQSVGTDVASGSVVGQSECMQRY